MIKETGATKEEIKSATNLPLVSGFTFCSGFQRAWYISLPLSLIDKVDIMGRVLHFGYSLESSGKKTTTQMLRTYSSPIKSETLDVGSCEQQGFFKLPWWFQRSANLRTTNLEFKFEAVQKRKLLIPWRKLKCEMSLSNRWRVIRESTWLCFMEHSSASGPGLVTQDYNFLCTPKHTT